MDNLGKKLLVTDQEACRLLGASDKTVREMVKRGDLDACKVRNCYRISVESINRYLNSIHQEDGISLLSTNNIIETPKAIKPRTAGEMMNTCTRTIYRLISDGSLPATKGHGGFQLSPQSVQDFVERQIEHYRAEELGY